MLGAGSGGAVTPLARSGAVLLEEHVLSRLRPVTLATPAGVTGLRSRPVHARLGEDRGEKLPGFRSR